ncbi:MAG: hypothetical protein ACK5TQ_09840, partial [Acetobacteraceae bacterium]
RAMVQTATQIFGLALEMSRASAPRISLWPEGTIRITRGFAAFLFAVENHDYRRAFVQRRSQFSKVNA